MTLDDFLLDGTTDPTGVPSPQKSAFADLIGREAGLGLGGLPDPSMKGLPGLPRGPFSQSIDDEIAAIESGPVLPETPAAAPKPGWFSSPSPLMAGITPGLDAISGALGTVASTTGKLLHAPKALIDEATRGGRELFGVGQPDIMGPTEPAEQVLTNALIPEEPGSESWLAPEITEFGPKTKALSRGVVRTATGLALDPLMYAGAGPLKGAAPYVFGALGAKGLSEELPQYKKIVAEKGWASPEALEELPGVVASTALTAMPGLHILRGGERGGPREVIPTEPGVAPEPVSAAIPEAPAMPEAPTAPEVWAGEPPPQFQEPTPVRAREEVLADLTGRPSVYEAPTAEAAPTEPPAPEIAPPDPYTIAKDRLTMRGVQPGESITKLLVDEMGVGRQKAVKWAQRMQSEGVGAQEVPPQPASVPEPVEPAALATPVPPAVPEPALRPLNPQGVADLGPEYRAETMGVLASQFDAQVAAGHTPTQVARGVTSIPGPTEGTTILRSGDAHAQITPHGVDVAGPPNSLSSGRLMAHLFDEGIAGRIPNLDNIPMTDDTLRALQNRLSRAGINPEQAIGLDWDGITRILQEEAVTRGAESRGPERPVQPIESGAGAGIPEARIERPEGTVAAGERVAPVATGVGETGAPAGATPREPPAEAVGARPAGAGVAGAEPTPAAAEAPPAAQGGGPVAKAAATQPPAEPTARELVPGADAARSRIADAAAKLGKSSPQFGVDPGMIRDYVLVGADHIARGLSDFASWSKQMVADFGTGIRDYLRGLWERAQEAWQTHQTERAAAIERANTAEPGSPEWMAHPERGAVAFGGGGAAAPERAAPAPPEPPVATPTPDASRRLRDLGWSEPEIRRLTPDQQRSMAEALSAPPPLGESMEKAGVQAPLVKANVAEYETAKASLPEKTREKFDSPLKRDSPQTWESLDPKVRDLANRILEPREITSGSRKGEMMSPEESLQNFYQKFTTGKISAQEVMLSDALVTMKREAVDRAREAIATSPDPAKANAEYLKAALDQANAEYAQAARSSIEGKTGLARALAASARMMKSIGTSTPDVLLEKIMREIPDISNKQATDLVDAFRHDPKAFPDLLQAAMRPSGFNKVVEAWKGGLFSALGTQFKKMTTDLLEQYVARPAETAVGKALDTMIPGRQVRVGGEVGAEYRGANVGAALAFGEWLRDVKDAALLQPEKVDVTGAFHVPAIGKGYIPGIHFGRLVRMPMRVLKATTDLAYSIGNQAELHKLAWREAKGNEAKYRQLVLDPPEEMAKAARVSASERNFTSPNELANIGGNITRRYPWMNFVIPVKLFPANIMKTALQRSIFGFKEAFGANRRYNRAVTAGRPAAEVDALRNAALDAWARPIVGTTVMFAAAAAAKSGYFTGSGPTDTKQRALLKATGWQPYSLHVGDTYTPYHWTEPLGTLLGIASDFSEASDSKTAADLFEKGFGAVVQNFTSKTYLEGLSDAAALWNDPRRFGPQYASNLAASIVPNIVRKTAQAIDPTVREIRPEDTGTLGLGEQIGRAIEAGIPGLSESLPPRRTGTGEVIQRAGADEGVAGALMRFASPTQITENRPGYELERVMIDVDAMHQPPARDVTIPGSQGRKVRLSDEEMGMLSDADQSAATYLRRAVANPSFRAMDPELQRKFVRSVFEDFRNQGRIGLYRLPSFQAKVREAMAQPRQ